MPTVAIALYPEFTSLDAMGPYQVLQHVPDLEVRFVAAERGILRDDCGALRIEVEHTFDDVPSPEILVVPGGTITRTMAHAGHPLVEWVRAAHPTTTWTTSVCTGSLILGAAGLLDGSLATTHWSAYEDLASFGASPTEQRVVRQGKVITGAGVSAGIDMALVLTRELAGTDVSEAIQLAIEYDPTPPHDRGAPSKARPEILDLVRAINAQAVAAVRSSSPHGDS
jgi:transcriptional regulator GlxA family with amidase domain